MDKLERLIPIIVLFGAALFGFYLGNRPVQKYQSEIVKYKENQEHLLSGLAEYRTSDSLRAIEIGVLILRLEEYKHFRAEDAKVISTLKTKNRELQSVVSTQSEMLANIKTPITDTVFVVRPGVSDTVQYVNYHDLWLDFSATMRDKQMDANISMRDSLIIVESVRYKRFLGFLWYTKQIKDRKIDAISKNPYNHIQSLEKILLEH